MNVIRAMTQAIPANIDSSIDLRIVQTYKCFECGEPVAFEELLLVDHMIETSPCFQDISENFAHCTGDNSLFHDNIVNCCPACYAAIVQTVAPCDDLIRRKEIVNLVGTLRALAKHPEARTVFDISVETIITIERLLENLVAVGSTPDITHAEVAEALYCRSSDLFTKLP